MLFESIPHIKDTYSGFKLEQISFPRDSGCCIASFWENKTNNKKKKTSRHFQPQRSRKAEKDFWVPFPWNSMSEAAEARQFPSVLCTFSTRGWENCRSREPMELYRLAPWKIDGFLFRVPKLRLSPSQMGYAAAASFQGLKTMPVCISLRRNLWEQLMWKPEIYSHPGGIQTGSLSSGEGEPVPAKPRWESMKKTASSYCLWYQGLHSTQL